MRRVFTRTIFVADKRKAPVEHYCSPGLWTDFGLIYLLVLWRSGATLITKKAKHLS
jgi:hypothetical protein